jgi:hypothetical protein
MEHRAKIAFQSLSASAPTAHAQAACSTSKVGHRSNARVRSAALLEQLAHYVVRPIQNLAPALVALAVIVALYVGWLYRDEGHITPEKGLGYWLGIVGGSMMLLLLLYPLRKRYRVLRYLGRVPSWFRIHMLLGIAGPVLILFHCNFKLGSLNSNVALVSMLIVVASGIAGRYLYSQVHRGLYGRKTEVAEIASDLQVLKAALGGDFAGVGTIETALRNFEHETLEPRASSLASLWSFLTVGVLASQRRRALSRQANSVLKAQAQQQRWSQLEHRQHTRQVHKLLILYFAAVRKAARFAAYERLLALWHVLHLPLFILLVFTAVIHVVAVHLY